MIMKRTLLFTLLAIVAFGTVPRPVMAKEKPKVIYFTHEPGRWHKYTAQKKVFSQIATKAGWELTIMTGDHDGQIAKLRTPDFAKGYDAVVYNFCFAKSKDLEAQANLVAQTKNHGVPAMLIHCAMHSWWPTYRDGKPDALGPDYKGKAKADPKLVAEWRKKHGDKQFPAWGDFTGVATGNTELYNNIYVLDKVVPQIEGIQGNSKAIVMWLCPQGKSKVLGLTVGHGVGDWATDQYRGLIADGVNYLIQDPKP